MTEQCEVCGNKNVPTVGYRHEYCPDCGSFYYYDESVTLILDSSQLKVVKIFTLLRAYVKRLFRIPVINDWYYEKARAEAEEIDRNKPY